MPDRNASPEPSDPPASAKKMSIADLELPPPGPANYVTDGYPHWETDPRNWPKPEERLSRDTRTARNGADLALRQRASGSRLQVLLRWWRR